MREGTILMFTLAKFIEILTGYIPQGVSFILFLYAFCRRRIDYRNFILSSTLMSASIFITRTLLPIHFGVHTLLNILVLIWLCSYMNKLQLNRSVIGALIVTILMLLVELINVGTFCLILGKEAFDQLMKNDALKRALTAIPAMVVFLLIIVAYYHISNRKREKKDAETN